MDRNINAIYRVTDNFGIQSQFTVTSLWKQGGRPSDLLIGNKEVRIVEWRDIESPVWAVECNEASDYALLLFYCDTTANKRHIHKVACDCERPEVFVDYIGFFKDEESCQPKFPGQEFGEITVHPCVPINLQKGGSA